MFLLITVLAFAVPDLPGKALPPINEPDWSAWKDAGKEARQGAVKAWGVLLEHRPDRRYETTAKRREAEEAVAAAYRMLEADKGASCAAGAEAMRAGKDDWERLMIATTLSVLDGEKGKPFLLWALANAEVVDESFEPVFEITGTLAAKRRPEDLRAVFSILRAREGHIYLPLHSWYIRTHDCLFYVIGRYGRGAIPYLYPMLKHADPYVRRNAAVVLGFFMDERSEPVLLDMLEANDVGSGGAAFALAQLGVPEAVKPIARLLKNSDARTRFWAAYALYEIGSRDALGDLVAASEGEKDRDVLQEMRAAIEHLKAPPKRQVPEAPKIGKRELNETLQAAERANGLAGDTEAIATSAGPDELDRLDAIRLKTMDVPSDMGNKWFQRWTDVIRSIRRR